MKDEIIKIILEFYRISKEEMLLKSREKELVECRQVICYFLNKYTSLSDKEIGKEVDLHRTTVLHAINTVGNYMAIERTFGVKIETLNREIFKSLGLKKFQRFIELEKNLPKGFVVVKEEDYNRITGLSFYISQLFTSCSFLFQ